MKKEYLINIIIIIFPIMFYYMIEAFIVGIFINIIWKFILSNLFGVLTYIQIVGIYWILKIILFDIIKLVTSLGTSEDIIIENSNQKTDNNEIQKKNTQIST